MHAFELNLKVNLNDQKLIIIIIIKHHYSSLVIDSHVALNEIHAYGMRT